MRAIAQAISMEAMEAYCCVGTADAGGPGVGPERTADGGPAGLLVIPSSENVEKKFN